MSDYAGDEAPDGEDDPTIEVEVNVGPIYDSSAHAHGVHGSGLQCSAFSKEFCFLCAFASLSSATEPGDRNPVVQLEDLITRLHDNMHPLADVCQAVHRYYTNEIRQDILYVVPKTKEEIARPKWSIKSIHRHLIYEIRWPNFFNDIQTNTMRGMLMLEANRLRDEDTNTVVQANKMAYFNTIKHYSAWLRSLSAIKPRTPKSMVQHQFQLCAPPPPPRPIKKKKLLAGKTPTPSIKSRTATPASVYSSPRGRGRTTSRTPTNVCVEI